MLASLVLVSFGALAVHATSAQPPVVEAVIQQPSAVLPATGQRPWPPEGVIRPGPGIVSPKLIKHPHPSYTAEAMRAGIEGEVFMEAVVLADGTVGEVRVTRPLDPGLDDQAVRTLKQWQFEPGLRDGVAVPVVIEVQMTFSLHAGAADRRAAVSPSPAPPSPSTAWPPAGVVRPGPQIVSPRLVREVKAHYTPAAMRAGIEGTVWLEAVVEVDGRVGEVRVTRSLDREHGLDEEAVSAVRQWRFEPGRKAEAAVPVMCEIQISFTLRK